MLRRYLRRALRRYLLRRWSDLRERRMHLRTRWANVQQRIRVRERRLFHDRLGPVVLHVLERLQWPLYG
jgi:hypothetical protein